ncbi:hypothetical protein SAMN05428936_107160 [Pelagibacterium halotolerans]|nr:hypothetical protein SAMN05428936_107160 [Pelagibacterium halotolerans]
MNVVATRVTLALAVNSIEWSKLVIWVLSVACNQQAR